MTPGSLLCYKAAMVGPILVLAAAVSTDIAELPKLAVLPLQVSPSARDRVPALADDYLLAAVQNTGKYQVIGPGDVSAMIGFEKEKELLGCDEVSCFADLGGALGVEQLAVFKAARLESDWAVTGKLINTTQTRVTARASHFVAGGGAKQLLQGLPVIVAKLFGTKPPAAALPARSTRPTASAPAPARAPQTDGASLLRPKDRRRYERHVAKTRNPMDVQTWARDQNKESTGLFVTEMLLLGGILFFPTIGISTGETTVTPQLTLLCILALPVVLILDGIDIGEVKLLPPPATAAIDRSLGSRGRHAGLHLGFAL